MRTSKPRQTTQICLSECAYPTDRTMKTTRASAARPSPSARALVCFPVHLETSRFCLEANSPRAQLRILKLRTRRPRAPADAGDGSAASYQMAVDLPERAESNASVVATQCPVPIHTIRAPKILPEIRSRRKQSSHAN